MIILVKQLCEEHPSCINKDLYLEKYGCHFNKKLCEYAISLMHHSNKPSNLSWELVMTILEKYNIDLNYDYPYDIYYVANMGYHDYFNSSIKDELHLALYVKDIFTDEDGYEGLPFCRWKADIKAKLIEINWEDMI